MKKPARPAHGPKASAYLCRKCLRSDFKTILEYTKHLGKCKGAAPVQPASYKPWAAAVDILPKANCAKCVKQLKAMEEVAKILDAAIADAKGKGKS